jgi:hypothetical protein
MILRSAQIEFVARQLIDDRGSCCAPQLQRALGVALEEIGDDQRRQVVADGQRRADAQFAVAGATFEHAFDRRRPLDQFDRLRQQRLSEFVETQVLPNLSKSCVSYCRSSSASAVLVADCDSASSAAARETLSWRATATNTPIWRKAESHIYF